MFNWKKYKEEKALARKSIFPDKYRRHYFQSLRQIFDFKQTARISQIDKFFVKKIRVGFQKEKYKNENLVINLKNLVNGKLPWQFCENLFPFHQICFLKVWNSCLLIACGHEKILAFWMVLIQPFWNNWPVLLLVKISSIRLRKLDPNRGNSSSKSRIDHYPGHRTLLIF